MSGYYRAGFSSYFDSGTIPADAILEIYDDYTVQSEDTYIVNFGTDVLITLESTPEEGRMIYIKDMNNAIITIDGNGNWIDNGMTYKLRRGFLSVCLLFSDGVWKVY